MIDKPSNLLSLPAKVLLNPHKIYAYEILFKAFHDYIWVSEVSSAACIIFSQGSLWRVTISCLTDLLCPPDFVHFKALNVGQFSGFKTFTSWKDSLLAIKLGDNILLKSRDALLAF